MKRRDPYSVRVVRPWFGLVGWVLVIAALWGGLAWLLGL